MWEMFLWIDRVTLANFPTGGFLFPPVMGVLAGFGLAYFSTDNKNFLKKWLLCLVVWFILEIVAARGFSGTISLWLSVTSFLFTLVPTVTMTIVSAPVAWPIIKNKRKTG